MSTYSDDVTYGWVYYAIVICFLLSIVSMFIRLSQITDMVTGMLE